MLHFSQTAHCAGPTVAVWAQKGPILGVTPTGYWYHLIRLNVYFSENGWCEGVTGIHHVELTPYLQQQTKTTCIQDMGICY